MIGRGAELLTIMDGLRRGVGAVIVGEAGLGKSVLVGEVQRRVRADGRRSQLVLCSGRQDFPLHTVVGGADGMSLDVLFVDDAHLLDDDSADLLWRLARQKSAVVVATVRSHEPVPDRVTRLWTGGSCERLDLTPLSEDEVRKLLEVVLGGDVEDRLIRLLVNRAQGNALLLRELVRFGVDSGAIAQSQQVWRVTGEFPIGAGAADMIHGSLVEFDTEETRAAQLLAIGEPLQLDIAEALITAPVLESLEDKRVAALVDTADGPALTLDHPLYGDVLRGGIAPLRLRRLRRELVAAFAEAARPRPPDVLRSVVWRLELGDTVDVSELLDAARLARSMSHSTAERLARAAVNAERSVDALLLLAQILVIDGRVAEADALLAELEQDALTGAERHALTYTRALGRTRFGELSDVIAMITGTEIDVGANSQQLQAVYGQSLVLDGRMDEALGVLRSLTADRVADPATQTLVTASVIVVSSFTGRVGEVSHSLREALPSAEASRTEVPYGPGNLMVAAAIALAESGHGSEAEAIGRQMYDRALVDDDEWSGPRGASALGVAALFRGQVRTATRFFRITVASLNSLDVQYLRYNLSYLARGAALSGFIEEARLALHPEIDAPRFPLFEANWQIAEAALIAAEGDLDAASDHAIAAARHAASLGQWAAMTFAAHDAIRYNGAPEAGQLLIAAADRTDGPLYRCLAEYANARLANAPKALVAASLNFEALGTILYAAEASYEAARAYRADDAGRAASAALVRAMHLHARCEDAPIPWAAAFHTVEVLTRREQQIALLAGAGNSDASIAAQLRISIRTVQNHLNHTYRKLAVANRRDLLEAISKSGSSR